MPLVAGCPRCRAEVEHTGLTRCPTHGEVRTLWSPDEVAYDDFADHLGAARDFPTYLPWPMSPGWCVTDFGVVATGDATGGRAWASVT
jgi:hypothetical protein